MLYLAGNQEVDWLSQWEEFKKRDLKALPYSDTLPLIKPHLFQQGPTP